MGNIPKIINLFKFEEYNVNSITLLTQTSVILGKSKQSLLKTFLEVLYVCFVKRVNYSYNNTSKEKAILCFGVDVEKRKDLRPLFDNVISTISDKHIIYEEEALVITINNALSNLLCVFVWLIQLRKSDLNYLRKLVLIRKLIEVLHLKRFIEKNKDITDKTVALVVFNDSLPSGNFIVQYFKKRKIKTSTLQHGIVVSPREEINNVDFSGLELQNSNSDYFLAWNEFTRKEALKAGMESEKVKVLGITRCINLENKVINNQETNVFGVVLDGEFTKENNPVLIKFAKEIAQCLGMKFIVRFHPRMDVHSYDNLLDNDNWLLEVSGINEDIYQYMKKVRFSLIANSTAYIEMIFMHHIVYKYNSLMDKYESVKWGTFSNIEELLNKLNSQESNLTEQSHLYHELITIPNIRESYANFFHDFYDLSK